MEGIVDAKDRLTTVRDILDYLSNTRVENGLCSILDHCSSQLQAAINSLTDIPVKGPKA